MFIVLELCCDDMIMVTFHAGQSSVSWHYYFPTNLCLNHIPQFDMKAMSECNFSAIGKGFLYYAKTTCKALLQPKPLAPLTVGFLGVSA